MHLVSIITPVLNSQGTIESTIRSVLGQTYNNIEYIIVDNGSTDRTLDIINEYKDKISKIIFEDRTGIYTTMNKGIESANGEIIGILNSDDIYANEEVIRIVVEEMAKKRVDACWGDLVYVDRTDTQKIIRYWKSSEVKPQGFLRGWMPPHPTFFVRRRVYEKYGFFNTEFKIAADYEIMLRFLYKHNVPSCYLPDVLVKMRTGGLSNRNFKNMVLKTREDYNAWKVNGLRLRFSTIILKNLLKIPQFFSKIGIRKGIFGFKNRSRPLKKGNKIKRIFDFLLALIGLFISLPLWLILALGIWLEDRGAVFYLQERVGKNGEIFKSIKFRSMIPDAERGLGPVQAQRDDLRQTGIGRLMRRTAMDELPQLINILKGDMSFVGPRALRLIERELKDSAAKSIFDFTEFKMRSQVRPGLTGVAQVFASRNLCREEKFKYDLWYIDNMSFWLDIELIARSVLATLKARWDA
jgi:lipopolysaccharide/colanic/teichoic acid biosynthesis glycosyltransferase